MRDSAAHNLRLPIALLAFASSLLPAVGQADQARPPLFGTPETRSDDLHIFPKWTGALERYFSEKDLPEGSCLATAFNRCHLADWSRWLETVRGLDRRSQIGLVNAYMNRKRYEIDPRNYGVPDYWATPRQFLYLDGDCEDYAIAKYLSLRALGVGDEDMRVVVLQDLNLGIAHAILVVYDDGRALVLDNQVPTVVDARSIRHYRPIYSLNERHWWLHGGA